jgi:hypothetical protein
VNLRSCDESSQARETSYYRSSVQSSQLGSSTAQKGVRLKRPSAGSQKVPDNARAPARASALRRGLPARTHRSMSVNLGMQISAALPRPSKGGKRGLRITRRTFPVSQTHSPTPKSQQRVPGKWEGG